MESIIKVGRKQINDLARIDSEAKYGLETHYTVGNYKKILNERFKENKETFFAFKKDKELIGYVTLKPDFPGYRNAEMYWLSVMKKYQKEGVGSKLLKFIETHAKKQGFRAIFLYTNKALKMNHSFYLKNKYKKINEFPGYYEDGNTAILFGKKL